MCVHECVVGKWVCIHVYGLMGVHTCVAGRWVCIDVCVVSGEWVWWVYKCAEDGCTCSWMDMDVHACVMGVMCW